MKQILSKLVIVVLALGAIPGAVRAQVDDLTVHGYFTQGYAAATDAAIYGIAKAGTFDYRAMALQFRYATSNTTAVVLQFSHRRLGTSLIQTREPDVGLDWGFVQAVWEDAQIRVGKIPMPRGLFNEIRDVGTLLPFFRASKAFYSEGAETVDGVSLSRAFDLGDTGFSLQAAAYAGEFGLVIETAKEGGNELIDRRATRTLGAQLRLRTPLQGLRFNADFIANAEFVAEDLDFHLLTGSAEYAQDRYFTLGEYSIATVKQSSTGNRASAYTAWYVQAGVGITARLWLNAQYEFNKLLVFDILPSPPLPSPDFEYDNIKDFAVGLSYQFTPLLVMKGEYHFFEGYQLDRPTPPLDAMTGALLPPGETDYFIISLSAAF